MNDVALVLEGGALRVVYTAGVLDVFLENNIDIPYVIGTSSGCLSGLNYVTNQKGRVAHININYCNDKRYIGFRNLLLRGSVFNFDYLFEENHDRWEDIDMAEYEKTNKKYFAVATSCKTGKPVYFENPKGEYFYTSLQASSSMPLLSKKVKTEQGECLDGGIVQSIPYQKPLADGKKKLVIVKTREHDYKKSETSRILKRIYKIAYGKYPQLVKSAIDRNESYNAQLEELYGLEKQSKAFIIEPSTKVIVKRTETDQQRLKEFYNQGRTDAENSLVELKKFLYEK